MKNVIFIFLSVLIITKLLSSESLVKPSKVNFGEKLNKSFNDRNMTKSGSKRSVQLPNASEIELLQRLLDVSPERLRFMKKAIDQIKNVKTPADFHLKFNSFFKENQVVSVEEAIKNRKITKKIKQQYPDVNIPVHIS